MSAIFTGIVQEVGTVAEIQPARGGMSMAIEAPRTARELNIGDSVSVLGACLTCVELEGNRFRVDLSPETLERTVLDSLTVGSSVNLELALRLSDRLGGHLVTGHVDGIGRLEASANEGDGRVDVYSAPPHVMRYVVEKGSIAVDGVSLTIASRARDRFEVALIPHTLRVTTLGSLKVGDKVNLEADLIGKYVARLLPSLDRSETEEKP